MEWNEIDKKALFLNEKKRKKERISPVINAIYYRKSERALNTFND